MQTRTQTVVLCICTLAGLATASAIPGSRGVAATQPQAPRQDKPRVELISPGAPERRELRYMTKADAAATVRSRTRITVSTTIDNAPVESPQSPTTVTPIAVTVVRVDQGVATLDVTPQQGTLDNDGSAELRDAVPGGKVKPTPPFRLSVSSTGRISAKSLSDGTTPKLREGGVLDALVLPFPDEPVGLGAKWRINAQDDVRGFAGQTIVEAELVELSATGGKARLTYRRSFDKAERDTIERAVKRGLTVTKSSRTIEYQGDITFDFESPVAKSVAHERVDTQTLQVHPTDKPQDTSSTTIVERTTHAADRDG